MTSFLISTHLQLEIGPKHSFHNFCWSVFFRLEEPTDCQKGLKGLILLSVWPTVYFVTFSHPKLQKCLQPVCYPNNFIQYLYSMQMLRSNRLTLTGVGFFDMINFCCFFWGGGGGGALYLHC